MRAHEGGTQHAKAAACTATGGSGTKRCPKEAGHSWGKVKVECCTMNCPSPSNRQTGANRWNVLSCSLSGPSCLARCTVAQGQGPGPPFQCHRNAPLAESDTVNSLCADPAAPRAGRAEGCGMLRGAQLQGADRPSWQLPCCTRYTAEVVKGHCLGKPEGSRNQVPQVSPEKKSIRTEA